MENNSKPLSLLVEDYMNNLVELTNQSQLPLLVTEYVLRNFINEIHAASQQQAVIDKQIYEKEHCKTKDGKTKDGD